MRAWKVLFVGVCAALPLAMGCSASVDKRELFAAYGDDGTPTYYRIKIHASGMNGAVEYRAGWYDATAVDDLFGDVGSDSRMRSDMAKMQRAAVSATMKAYLDALVQEPGNEALLVTRKKAFDNALGAMGGTGPMGASATALLDYSQKKFVIVLSLRPDEIIAAVKGYVQKQQLLDAVQSALQARGDAETQVLRVRLEALDKSVEQATSDIDAAPTHEVLLKTLSKVKAEAELIP